MERSVGIQLYMTRDYLGSENEIAETLQRISDIGYDGVELCNFLMRREEVQFWKTNMDRFNLNTLAIHEVFEDMKTDIDECIKRAEFFETTSLVSAGAMKVGFEDSEQVLRLAKELNQVGRQLKAHGLTLMYHNHNCEFVRTEKGTIPMDILLEETDPEYVKFEVDTFWIANSGFTVMEWLDKIGVRMGYMHINDCKVCPDKPGVPIRHISGTELGMGNMNLPEMVRKAEANGCSCQILETHEGWIRNCPFESMRISREYLRKHFK